MAKRELVATEMAPEAPGEDVNTKPNEALKRRSFLKGVGVAGVALSASSLLPEVLTAQTASGGITKGDAAILRFLAAAEILETDLWLQYNEFGGIQDGEVDKMASQMIPGYPASPTGGNPMRSGSTITWWPMERHRPTSTSSVLCPAARLWEPTRLAGSRT